MPRWPILSPRHTAPHLSLCLCRSLFGSAESLCASKPLFPHFAWLYSECMAVYTVQCATVSSPPNTSVSTPHTGAPRDSHCALSVCHCASCTNDMPKYFPWQIAVFCWCEWHHPNGSNHGTNRLPLQSLPLATIAFPHAHCLSTILSLDLGYFDDDDDKVSTE